jgi:hypothetical protein
MDKLRTSPTVTCACGQQIKVDATDLDRSMREVDATEKVIDDAIKGFPKTIGG